MLPLTSLYAANTHSSGLPAPPTDATVAYQVNSQHNGTVSGDSLSVKDLGESDRKGDTKGNRYQYLPAPKSTKLSISSKWPSRFRLPARSDPSCWHSLHS